MPRTQELTARSGDRFELWAKARHETPPGSAPLSFRIGDRTVYQIAHLPPYYEAFSYTHHSDQALTITWDDTLIEVSLFYRYNPQTVADIGVTFLEFGPGGLAAWPADRLSTWYEQEAGRPQLRFSPFKGWMNDPNGLCKAGDTYHLFYQYHPNGVDWGPMHWGHAASKDLYRWIHYPVFQYPEANLAALGATGGAFSGNAFFDRDGALSFYYTERLPAYDLFKDYKEVQKRMRPDKGLLRPVANALVLADGPEGTTHDIRDPKVWYDGDAGLYRMVLGSSVDGDPALLLYNSADGDNWDFASILYRAPPHFRDGGARSAECPDFFVIDGHWVLVAGFVGYTEAETGRHNLLYAVTGSFENGVFTPYSDQLQELDFGTDYYAMQSFWDGERQLAFAWLFNWEIRKPAGSAYSGELSLPRLLTLDQHYRLLTNPEPGIATLRTRKLEPANGRYTLADGRAVEMRISGKLNGLTITGTSASGETVTLTHSGESLALELSEDDGRITYRTPCRELADTRLFFDRGVIELFANGGLLCGTRRSYRVIDCASLWTSAEDSASVEVWEYKSAYA
ncbi:beta-fructofuranosidase [Devosia yakushimensis]|uniref:beta-fructofuranosidase n=1 Tax=Devosia yakushimensis TaxID=470028 RepID=A0ABQ5UH84_9HYPH|nr:glycoside hydrolase family 32 protein [Devosia yakushimensis]GLQ11326.1 beta-fructofuranosidase [Devosia yakushimensis]